jgi:hypothetical protein
MIYSRIAHVLALTGLFLASGLASAWPGATADQAMAVSVEDFSYLDTSGESTDQVATHQTRLQSFMAALKRDINADPHLHLVSLACALPCAPNGQALHDRLHAASQAGAKFLIIGSIQKLSTLVQWARAAAIDVASNRVVFEKFFTFRGDSGEAWERAEAFVSEEIREALASSLPAFSAAAPARIRLAIFKFELEDTSAGVTEPRAAGPRR